MSEGDFAIVRDWYRSFRDEGRFQALTHPDIEWLPIEHNHTIHRGLDGASRVLAEWNDSWSAYSGQVERVIDAGELGIVVVFDINAVGAMSGVEVTLRQYAHFKTREGKVTYLYEYANLAEDLEAIGLQE